MEIAKDRSLEEAQQYLIKSAGWMSQDLGLGRIIGEVMAVVYVTKKSLSLDDIADALDLSKAAVSIATRQLDKLSLLERVRTRGDRKTYYKTSEHFAASLQKGILEMLRTKLQTSKEVFEHVEVLLKSAGETEEKEFLKSQLARAKVIRKKADFLLNNPLMKLLK
jgi:DNA-binding transcriptional regulator GbsR (MarR family)